MTTPEIQRLEVQLREIGSRCIEEFKKRSEIESLPEFRKAQAQKDAAELVMQGMLEGVADSKKEYEEAKKALIEAMKRRRITDLPGWHCSLRKRSEVNKARLWEAVGGDIDLFTTIATVTQKAVKEYADQNPAFRKQFLECIEEVGTEVSDLEEEISHSK